MNYPSVVALNVKCRAIHKNRHKLNNFKFETE